MKRLLCLVLPPLLVAIIATVALARGVTAHPDEPLWIASAYYFDRLVHGDVSHPDWQLLPARETPPVGKYLFGAALWLQGRPIRSIERLASWYEGWRAVPGAFGTGREAAEREAVVHRLPADVRTAVSQGLTCRLASASCCRRV